MIANHASRLDHFLILSSFSFGTFYKLLPVRFMTASNYMSNALQKFVLILLGCFPHKTADKNYSSIEKSIRLLNMNQRVFIYPEGERVKSIEDSEPKRGVGTLSLESNYPILPIRIKGSEHLTLKKIILRKADITILIGRLIRNKEAKSKSNNANTIAKELMKRVYGLE
jgi:1-acyl-sn-glycerol-3-phosphate acyltransferase